MYVGLPFKPSSLRPITYKFQFLIPSSMRKTPFLTSSLIAQIFQGSPIATRVKTALMVPLLVLLLMAGIIPSVNAGMILDLDSTHFKLEVIQATGGNDPVYKVRVTFLNTNLQSVGGLKGVAVLQTNLPATDIMTKAVESPMETIRYKVGPSYSHPNRVELQFDLSSAIGSADAEVRFEWVIGVAAGSAITSTQATLDGIVAVEILDGCKRCPDSEPVPGSDDIQVFPNPTMDFLSVQLHEDGPLPDHLRICSATGQVLAQAPVTAALLRLDLRDLPPGTYFVQGIRQGEATFLRRVIKR